MPVFSVHEAKTHLSRILTLLKSDDEVVISRYGTPVARIVPFEQTPRVRKPGALKNLIEFDESFFDELPEEELSAWSQQS
ncbi:MAG: type II toxin-antitoxin system prevent-host-death family antitoxin [Acidiferrobacterales bacterium]|nr:type II toxin-antitoxin system prevent-host-death family antitoxin [Acidiferrobacterales bacterium]